MCESFCTSSQYMSVLTKLLSCDICENLIKGILSSVTFLMFNFTCKSIFDCRTEFYLFFNISMCQLEVWNVGGSKRAVAIKKGLTTGTQHFKHA